MVKIELELPNAVEFKMWIEHVYNQQEEITMSVEQALSQLKTQIGEK